jgi:hypothetical protein
MPNAPSGRRCGAKTQGMYFQSVAYGGTITRISPLQAYSQPLSQGRGGLSDRIGRQATIARAMTPETGEKPPVTSANLPWRIFGMATLRGNVGRIEVLCRAGPVSPGRESVKRDLVTCHLLDTEGRRCIPTSSLMHWVNQFVGRWPQQAVRLVCCMVVSFEVRNRNAI